MDPWTTQFISPLLQHVCLVHHSSPLLHVLHPNIESLRLPQTYTLHSILMIPVPRIYSGTPQSWPLHRFSNLFIIPWSSISFPAVLVTRFAYTRGKVVLVAMSRGDSDVIGNTRVHQTIFNPYCRITAYIVRILLTRLLFVAK